MPETHKQRVCVNCSRLKATERGQFWRAKSGQRHWLCEQCSTIRTEARKKARQTREP